MKHKRKKGRRPIRRNKAEERHSDWRAWVRPQGYDNTGPHPANMQRGKRCIVPPHVRVHSGFRDFRSQPPTGCNIVWTAGVPPLARTF